MAHIVKCRACKQSFDTDKLSPDDWVENPKRFYFHKRCYQEFKNADNIDNAANMDKDGWFEKLKIYLYEDIKLDMNFAKVTRQWNRYTEPNSGMTPKGVVFALKYFYEVKHGDTKKADGGIGIVPSIYNEAIQYWINLENRKEDMVEAIVKDMEMRSARPVIVIKQKKPVKKDKSKWKLEDI